MKAVSFHHIMIMGFHHESINVYDYQINRSMVQIVCALISLNESIQELIIYREH